MADLEQIVERGGVHAAVAAQTPEYASFVLASQKLVTVAVESGQYAELNCCEAASSA